MKIDTNIVNALESYRKENNLSYIDLADRFNVTPAAITKWRKVGNGLSQDKWDLLLPLIKDFLPKSKFFLDDAGKEQYESNSSNVSGYVFNPKYVPIVVPKFNFVDLMSFDNTIDTITQFAKNRNITRYSDFKHKSIDSTGVFALEVDNSYAAPVIPTSSTVFVSSSTRPQNNSIVLVLSKHKKISLGKYLRIDDKIEIIDFKGNNIIQFDSKNARDSIIWIFPVICYEVICEDVK